jgi:hypothetical protein
VRGTGQADSDTPATEPALGFVTAVTTQTALDGSFLFIGIPPGDYKVTAVMRHYVQHTYGELIIGGMGRSFGVNTGERIESVILRMTKKSVITGTVVDESGSPMANALIAALQRAQIGTTNSLQSVGEPVRTDALGKYRLEDLDPGDYYISAQGRVSADEGSTSGGRGAVGGRGGPAAQIGPTSQPSILNFYQGVYDPSLAAKVNVTPETTVQGIDFAIRPIRSASVSVTISPSADQVGGVAESQTGRSMVALVPIGIEVAGQQGRVSRAEADEGRAQFNSVIPGAYEVVAVSVNRLVAAAQDI